MSWIKEAKKSAARRGSEAQQPETGECQELLNLVRGGNHLLDEKLRATFRTDEEICAWLRKPSLYLGNEAPAFFVRSMEFGPVLLAFATDYPNS